MANFSTLRSYKFSSEADDIRGAKLYGRNDEKLGELEDVIFDQQTGDVRYAVVDTGGWLTHKRFLVPADRIEMRGDHTYADEMDYKIDLSKADIERLPKFDPDTVRDDERWKKYEDSYRAESGKYFASGGVLHQADSANIITPPAMQPKAGADNLPPIREDLRLRRQFNDQTAGPMNTSPMATGDTMDTDRLTLTSENSVTQPDLQTTDTSLEEEDEGMRLNRSTTGDQRKPIRKSQPLPGEFVDAPNAPDYNWTEGNRTNTHDAEFRTAEGDSIFNASDSQEQAYGSRSKGSEGTEGGNPGSRIGNRWTRFQGRLRDERDKIAAHNQMRNKDAA